MLSCAMGATSVLRARCSRADCASSASFRRNWLGSPGSIIGERQEAEGESRKPIIYKDKADSNLSLATRILGVLYSRLHERIQTSIHSKRRFLGLSIVRTAAATTEEKTRNGI